MTRRVLYRELECTLTSHTPHFLRNMYVNWLQCAFSICADATTKKLQTHTPVSAAKTVESEVVEILI